MLLFGITAALCAGIAVLAVASPRIGLGAVFAAYILLPFTPVGRIGAGLHVATMLVLAMAAVRLLVVPRNRTGRGQRQLYLPLNVHVLVLVFVVGASANQFLFGSAPLLAGAFLLNQIVAPYLFFLLCIDAGRDDPQFLPLATKAFVLTGAIQAGLAVLIANGLVAQPFATRFGANYWWEEVVANGRQLGTLDTPLNLGLFLAACVPLVLVFRRMPTRIVCLALLMTGLFFTQSRIGILAGVVGLVYLALFGLRGTASRLTLVAGTVLGYLTLSFTGALDAFFERVADDKGSSEARSSAWEYLLSRWHEFLVQGEGIFGSRTYLIEHGFSSSAESALFGYSMAFGLIFTLCYFAAMIWIIIEAVRFHGKVTAATLSAMIVLVSIQLYSSITTESSAAYILWTTLYFAIGSVTTIWPKVSPEAGITPQGAVAAGAGGATGRGR
ncbi:hypothetical protein PBI_HOWE_31 [Gordonia phage Howe]|uniref:Uncharacterized protein n=1 Tax=Gordonia phage Howe TaxID=1777061 RepID=A0A0U4JHA7_9CAUD|nr:hypothetical protein PP513_gp31 [Gordonia phage Howe]AZF93219.1 hypothetical protein SEA_ADORA_31 [Gordonia phage Adora]QDF16812.1 glycosyltransferase [Gordonia phage Twinkle]QYC54432.1 membrane protein [Gordonia phage Shlim410]UAJ16282.1 glycosyltransferase [Gordonia phage Hortense]ALY07665.1 hypothetical protein PBI_HOWE_31 [Gordonia phage Howe]